jgi:cytochrome c5
MSRLNSVKSALVWLSLCAASVLGRVGAAPQDLPPGPGVEIARNRCLRCHEADVIVVQKLTRAGWEREVEKMKRWGAIVKDDEQAALVDYFAARFTAQPTALPTTTRETHGKEIFEAKCQLCHESDVVVAQRLSQAGWGREVDKMVRWGAVVNEEDKGPLVDYLFKNYGPRPLTITR